MPLSDAWPVIPRLNSDPRDKAENYIQRSCPADQSAFANSHDDQSAKIDDDGASGDLMQCQRIVGNIAAKHLVHERANFLKQRDGSGIGQ